jgi:oligopeptide transport system substrate-binding protein
MRRLIYRLTAFALLAAIAVLATPVAAQLPRGEQAKQAITFDMSGEPRDLDPSRSSLVNEGTVVRQVFQPLLRLDQHLVPRPAAAASYDVSPDGKTYTFHLRRDGRWSDGQQVRASQFEYSWKRILDPKLAAPYASFFVDAGIVGAEDYNSGKVETPDNVGVHALDDLTLEIDLIQPFGPLADLATLREGVPERPDIVTAHPDDWALDPSTYVGNGPFRMSEWVHNGHITLVPNPNYVGTSMWPTPTLQQVTLVMVGDYEYDYAAYQRGERDWTLVPDSEVNTVQSDTILSQQSRQYNQLRTSWVAMNNTRRPLDNPNVRKALAKAIDRQALVHQFTAGVDLPFASIIPPGMPAYQDSLGRELGYDPEAARSLIAQAGYPNGQGFPDLQFSTAGQITQAKFVQTQWLQNLNIKVQLDPMEINAYQSALKAKHYDLAFAGWNSDYPDPQDWFSTLFGCKGGNNRYNYCNPQFDQLVAQADTGADLNERLALYSQAQAILIQDTPVVPLSVLGRFVLIKPWVQSVGGGPLPITAQDGNPGDMFLDMVQIAPH